MNHDDRQPCLAPLSPAQFVGWLMVKRLIRDARQIRAARRATFVGPAPGHSDTTAGRP